MSDLPREPEAFTEHVARHFKRQMPYSAVEPTGPLQITIDDYAVGLENLHRATMQTDEPHKQLVDRFIEAFVNAQQLEQAKLPFDVIAPTILPRIQPESILDEDTPPHIVHQPYINGTVIVFMIDLGGASTPVTAEHQVRWGINTDELDLLARDNLADHKPNLELNLYQGEQGAAALFTIGDGYDASRLLLDNLFPKLAPEMGGNFHVAIPSRDTFIAFPTEPRPFVHKLKGRIQSDFKRLPYPITADLFLVTLDGVAGCPTEAA
ncbi:MAG: DUF1444 family protein [Planctomycetota bacterium]|jgi:hypothetical protein